MIHNQIFLLFSDVNITNCNQIHTYKIVGKNLHYSHLANSSLKCEVTLISHRIHKVLERTISGQATFLRMESNVNVRICHMNGRKKKKTYLEKKQKIILNLCTYFNTKEMYVMLHVRHK